MIGWKTPVITRTGLITDTPFCSQFHCLLDLILTAARHVHVGPLDYADLESKNGDATTCSGDQYALALGHLGMDNGSPSRRYVKFKFK